LRERPEDISVLAAHFARQLAEQNNWKPRSFSEEAIARLLQYSWPGNVREMRNVVERTLLIARGEKIEAEDVEHALPQSVRTAVSPNGHHLQENGPLASRVESFERETLLAELKRHHYHMTNTAKALGLERSHLYKKCQQLGIDLRALRTES
jgi:DNA-binding NtrC family response regulator